MSEYPFLEAYLKASQKLMSLNPDLEMPVAIASTLAGAAIWSKPEWADDPMSIEELAERLRKPTPTIYTHLRYLGEFYREGKPGLGLIYTEPHRDNARKKVCRLTPKGEALVRQLENLWL